jgi:hypothetical protein
VTTTFYELTILFFDLLKIKNYEIIYIKYFSKQKIEHVIYILENNRHLS